MTLVLVAVALAGCNDEKQPAAKAPGRFAAVKKDTSAGKDASRTFCDHSFPKTGETARSFLSPPDRPLPAKAQLTSTTPAPSKGWRWVNLWATWCRPCTDEMPLLGRWRDTLESDGLPIALELWSVDEDEAELKSWLEKKKMPGTVRWLKDADALGAALESFGIERTSAIPIHLFVDAQDQIRCVRVGAVHQGDFGTVKTILADG